MSHHDGPQAGEGASEPPDAAMLRQLVEQREAFVRFVRPRVESDAAAEEVVQAAFLRSVERAGALEADESATAWFYRILRNAVVDHYRRRDARGRALERLSVELPETFGEALPDDKARVCGCVRSLAATLKPEYAAVLEQVDVEGRSVSEIAGEVGITANNAAVRLHRARAALKRRVEETCRACAEHGCVDCTCKHG
jgi:RNA polymerase sigma-70 factor (ECF subfamily)